MKYISHRGNINGRVNEWENHPDYIQKTMNFGYEVEIDIWKNENNLFLGHDKPTFKIKIDWLLSKKNKLWIHCKNDTALFYLNKFEKLNIFYHVNDPFTISSANIILINPFFDTKYRDGILMMPELSKFNLEDIKKFNGIITDNIQSFENNINNVG